MRAWSLLLGLLSAVALPAGIMPTPGSVPVQPVFEKADIVCSCVVESAALITRADVGADGGSSKVMRVAVTVLEGFRAEPDHPGSIVFELPADQQTTAPWVQKDEKVLLFLSKGPAGGHELADRIIGLTRFSLPLPQTSGETGLDKLQEALAASLIQGNSEDQIHAMQLLEGFDPIRPGTLSAVSPLVSSADPEIAFTALGVLLRTKTPESVATLKRYLDAYSGDQPVAIDNVTPKLSQIRDERALPDLEALSGSRFKWVRFGAMNAIRHIAGPGTVPFLIQRLSYPDRDVQYQAVMTLTEIFKKGGEYGPDVPTFEKDPDKYIGLWKRWWGEEGARQFPQ